MPADKWNNYKPRGRARDFLTANYLEPVTIRDLARVAALSPNRVIRHYGGRPHPA